MMKRTLAGCVIVLLIALLLCSSIPSTTGGSGGSPDSVSTSLHAAVTPAILSPPPPSAFSTGMAASLVLGQPNFTGSWTTANASAFRPDPELAQMDSHGDIWVADYGGNRVMEFAPPFSNGEAASLVLGQSNFLAVAAGTSATNLSGPSALGIDAHGDVWVSDFGNDRVLEFTPPFHTGMAASLVIGQSDFSGYFAGTTAVNLSGPFGISFDTFGDMWLVDYENSRVLEYRPPFSTGMAASLVLGQTSFTSGLGGTTQDNLSQPSDAVLGGNILWVSDYGNNRVVGYHTPFYTGENADYLLGQTSFTSTSATGAAALLDPVSVSVDGSGDLWVSDSGDSRVVEFPAPFYVDENPIVAIGQSSLTGTSPGNTATTLSDSYGAFVAPSGDLWVTDATNNRILEYIPQNYSVTVTASGLPVGTPWTAAVDGLRMTGTGALDFSEVNGSHTLTITPVPGYSANATIVPFIVNGSAASLTVAFAPAGANPLSDGMPASLVLGQPNFDSAFDYNQSTENASDLTGDNYAAVFDHSGDLWVADGDANRVLEYHPPFSNYMAASLVLGQSSFAGTGEGLGASNLSFPDGLAFDSSGDLWVASFTSNQVVEYVPPFTTGMAATLVIGQAGFGTNVSGSGAAELNGPSGIAFEHGDLWVTDYANNRVLSYTPPFANGEAATMVLGQSNLTGDLSATTATNLSEPDWITFDSNGGAWVADSSNDRVLEFPAPITTGEAATVVLGQSNFTTRHSTYLSSTSEDNGVFIDNHGNVWVADSGNNRVLEFAGPTTSIVTGQNASLVIGQGNLSTDLSNTSRTGLSYPTLPLMDAQGNLWVVDDDNNRVLEYAPAKFSLNFTESGLPSGTSWGIDVNGASTSGMASSTSLVELNGTYDWSASNVLGWTASPSSGVVTVNGGLASVAIAYAPFAYAVTFTETGLPSGTNWSVTIGGSTHSSTGPSIGFNEPNGTHVYTLGTVSGYSASNETGVVTVNAAAASVTIAFTSSSSGSGGSGLSTTDLIVLAIVVIAIIAAIGALVLMRRNKGSTPPPTPWNTSPGAGTPPAPGGGPPPGAMGPPPPSGPPPPPRSVDIGPVGTLNLFHDPFSELDRNRLGDSNLTPRSAPVCRENQANCSPCDWRCTFLETAACKSVGGRAAAPLRSVDRRIDQSDSDRSGNLNRATERVRDSGRRPRPGWVAAARSRLSSPSSRSR
jgi:sugar lactone lactonase YvrE